MATALVPSHRQRKNSMTRLSRIVVLFAVVLELQVPLTAAPAIADPIGGVIVIPGAGTDLDAIRLRTSAGCPEKATAYYARMRGRGLPPEGQIITANTKAGMSHSSGFDVYVALIMRDYAKRYNATLSGRYDITVYCINRLTVRSYGEFTGSLEFTSPTAYEAIGAARPTGPPLPPPAFAGGLVPGDAVPPSGAPAAPGSSTAGAAGQPAASPGVDPRISSSSQRLDSQPKDVAVRGAPWSVVILVSAAVGAFVVALAAGKLRKRGTP